MKYSIYYHPEIIDEIDEAINWYAEKMDGLDMRFGDALLQAEITISNNPLAYQKKYKNLRQFKVEGFPYLLIFYTDQQSIFFHRLIHTSRSVKTRYRKR